MCTKSAVTSFIILEHKYGILNFNSIRHISRNTMSMESEAAYNTSAQILAQILSMIDIM